MSPWTTDTKTTWLLTNTVGGGMVSGMSPLSGVNFTGTSRDGCMVTDLWPLLASSDCTRAALLSSAALLLFVLGPAPSFRTASFMKANSWIGNNKKQFYLVNSLSLFRFFTSHNLLQRGDFHGKVTWPTSHDASWSMTGGSCGQCLCLVTAVYVNGLFDLNFASSPQGLGCLQPPLNTCVIVVSNLDFKWINTRDDIQTGPSAEP